MAPVSRRAIGPCLEQLEKILQEYQSREPQAQIHPWVLRSDESVADEWRHWDLHIWTRDPPITRPSGHVTAP